METTVDAEGRILLPEVVQREAGIHAGVTLEVRVEDGRVVLEPRAVSVRYEQRGPFTVAVTKEGGARLTAAEVEETRQKLRSE